MRYSRDHLAASHREALLAFGEHALFVLMWQAADHRAGLVGRCPACYAGDRLAQAYGQAPRERCPECFGTTYQGGYRARVVRPALFADSAPDSTDGPRGAQVSDSLSLETTGDLTIRHGDYVFRGDRTRWRVQQASGPVLRDGLDGPDPDERAAGTVGQATYEDEASVAQTIPPTDDELASWLRAYPAGAHLPPDFSGLEDVRGPLVVGP